MSAFDDGNRNIAWMNSTAELYQLPAIALALGGSFTDVLLPRTATAADVNKVRAQHRQLDGAAFGCGIYEIAFTSATLDHPHVQAQTHLVPPPSHDDGTESALYELPHVVVEGSDAHAEALARPDVRVLTVRDNKSALREVALSAAQGFATQVAGDVQRLRDAGASPGYVDLDCEVSDAVLGQFMRDIVGLLRQKYPTLLLRLNIDPNKTGWLPVDLLVSDQYLYVAVQTYYGDMSMVAPWALKDTLYAAGVPRKKVHLCIGGATQAKSASEPWHRVSAIPSVFYQGNSIRRLPGPTTVFSTDLLADAGLL